MSFKKLIFSMFCVMVASAIAAQNLIPNQYVLGNTSSTNVLEPFVKENGDYFLFISVSDGVSNQFPGNLGVMHYGESYFVFLNIVRIMI